MNRNKLFFIPVIVISLINTSYAQNTKSSLSDPGTWCKQQTGLLGGKKVNTALISEEFKVKDLELQTIFAPKLLEASKSKAFVSAVYWRSSFETTKIRSLYDAFVAFPEPDILAVIIDASKNATDPQIKNDARMALVFIHMAVPEQSVNPNRWSDLLKQAGSEHWTALTFRARLAAYGEMGVKQDTRTALGLLTQAGNKKMEYIQSRGRSEWDKNNYEVQYNSLIFDVISSAPGQFPAFEQFNDKLAKIEMARKAYYQSWPSTRAGKLSFSAIKLNEDASKLGDRVIELGKSGNVNAGQIDSAKSLSGSKQGDKQTYVGTSSGAELIKLEWLKNSQALEPEQIKLLKEAQEKRIMAQGLIAETQNIIAAQLFGGTGSNNFGEDDIFIRAGMLVPVMAEAQIALIQSCAISAKWEQANRLKNVPATDSQEVVKKDQFKKYSQDNP